MHGAVCGTLASSETTNPIGLGNIDVAIYGIRKISIAPLENGKCLSGQAVPLSEAGFAFQIMA